MRRLLIASVVVIVVSLLGIPVASADTAVGPQWGNTDAFWMTWDRTDDQVSTGSVNRTWMWGPDKQSLGDLRERYQDAPGGWRTVRYFDKSRMEITHPSDDPTSQWYVTNGLLAEELITGRVQLGDSLFDQQQPAQVNVAGDLNDPNGPTYATFNPLMSYAPIPSGWAITSTVNRAGQVSNDPSTAGFNVTAKDVGAPTHHTVASVFWQFMNSSGPIEQINTYNASAHTYTYVKTTGPLFSNPFYATGYPLTEAYWTHVLVGGVSKLVLVQVFERRVLTYTPSNPSGWTVEAGNVGQQYFTWRYGLPDVQYDFAASVPAATQTVMKDCVGITRTQFGAVGPAYVTVPGSLDASVQAATSYFGGTLPSTIQQDMPTLEGISFGSEAIVIKYTDNADACDTVGHVYYYLVENVQSRFSVGSTPKWLTDGIATYAGAQAQITKGYITVDKYRHDQMAQATHYSMALADTSNDLTARSVLGYLAADWLASHCGSDCFTKFWASLPTTNDWQTSFAQAFGLSVDDFYNQFAQYRAQKFPSS